MDALHMFEHRLDEIGHILWDAFLTICAGENVYSLALKFYREAFKPERNLKKDDLLNFLKSKFDNYHEQVVKQVVKQYFIEEKMSDITLRRKSLILSPKVYQYILLTYGRESELAIMCLEDILILRIYIDNPNVEEISTCTRDSIISVFDSYIKAKVPYKPKYLDLLQKATSLEIIKPFYEVFLPTVFGMKLTPKVSKSRKNNNPKKRKRSTDDIVVPWIKNLNKLIYSTEEIMENCPSISGSIL